MTETKGAPMMIARIIVRLMIVESVPVGSVIVGSFDKNYSNMNNSASVKKRLYSKTSTRWSEPDFFNNVCSYVYGVRCIDGNALNRYLENARRDRSGRSWVSVVDSRSTFGPSRLSFPRTARHERALGRD